MSSHRTLLALLLLLTTTLSSPLTQKSYTNLHLPPSTLPPPTGLQLRYILLGLGTQNYTCASSTASSTPLSIGALATLYDLSALNTDPDASRKIPSIPLHALSAAAHPASSHSRGGGSSRMLTPYLTHPLGTHFFTPAGTPTFHLRTNPSTTFVGHKNASAPAPARSCGGEDAVDWLFLDALPETVPKGALTMLYRVETAGGKAPATCEGVAGGGGMLEVPYAAEYWVYGP